MTEVTKLGHSRERIVCHGDVVVSEHDKRRAEALEERSQESLAPRMRDEIAGHAHQIGTTIHEPVDGPAARGVHAGQRRAEVEVGEVADSEPVELCGEAGNLDVEHAGAEPAGLEPPVGKHADEDHEQESADEHQQTLEPRRATTTLRRVGSAQDETGPTGLRDGIFVACVAAIVALVGGQSIVHLALALGARRIGTVFDLDRSNGVPDLASTLVQATATLGAAALALVEDGSRRLTACLAALLFASITLADLLHDGAHPSRSGFLVIALVIATVCVLVMLVLGTSARVRTTVTIGICLLAGAFLTSGLDRIGDPFRGERGDVVVEWRIVVKEGFELAGWSLVALGLWDAVVGRRAPATSYQAAPLLDAGHDL